MSVHPKARLELTWVGKDVRPRLEPRVLIEDASKSYAVPRVTEQDIFDNRLIFGDNLLALKALEQEFANKIKCIFIDPPYNTGSAFEHYDDGIEHSIWLSLMRDRLELLRRLLSEDGSLWVTIDDNEAHYLKILCDEVFGRANFVANVIWQKKYAPANDTKWLSDDHDHVLVFAKNKKLWRPNKLSRSEEQDRLYSNPDGDPRGPWMSDNYTCAKSMEERPNLYYPITNPNTGERIFPKPTRVWAFDRAAHERHVSENMIYWGKKGRNGTPRLKKFKSLLRTKGRVTSTVWPYTEVGHTQDARREAMALNATDPFATPKPERLLARIIEIGSKPGDWVLDSFGGSGTTAAVAHKMGRRWIVVELGEHCHTHIAPRLRAVIDGSDTLGISPAVEWKGGGGFKYFRVAPSLLRKDKWNNWIINENLNQEMLVEALCKIEGFTFAPDVREYWQQGYSTERDFIYVTTQQLTADQLAQLNQEVGSERSLLVLCGAFHGVRASEYPNLTIKKIPKQVLTQCEWGRDDYTLNVQDRTRKPSLAGSEFSDRLVGDDLANT